MAAKCVPASDFTIGWVCALPIELAAASGMMDEEYAQLDSRPNDSNRYTYGRIGVHNIVVACLPAGQMGTNSAATVASQMRSSFESLRFGLLVGIGGGVPNLEDDVDIRLGDVVISQPSGQYGGVIQYDFGKTGADGRIARIGSLNAPPTILLNALSHLRANDILDKTKINEYLLELLSSKPKFASPGPDNDVLYEAVSQNVSRARSKKRRREDVVEREQRKITAPALFFGNIASGNQVMKDGPTRDKHSQELGGVLCFEMEAAGLMNNFPCLVIRGICDYADAHKNKQWQPYAAATAAALAKELLCTIPSTVSNAENVVENPLHQPHFIVPFGRNKHFVGRDDILTKLLKRIPPSADEDACQRTAIIGLGGIGKTQVAIEAAYRVRRAHPDCSVFWVPAVNTAMFDNHYRKIGQALQLKGIDGAEANIKTLVKDALERGDINNWLLIIDNADDIDLVFTKSGLASYIPTSRKGSVLLTTRNNIVAARYDRTVAINLSKMDAEEGVKLLHSGLDESQIDQGQSTTQLLVRLAHLPLAIRQASAYLRANQATSVSQYLEYCDTSDEEQIALLSEDFDDQDRYQIIQNPVATTWLISFENIARDKPLAAKYLSFICYLAEKDIPMALLPPGDNTRQSNEAINTLLAYAFIQKRSSAKSFDVHRLVRLVMRTWLREHDKEEQQITETINRLSVAFPLPKIDDKRDWIVYVPHAQAVLKMSKLRNNGKALWDLLRKVGDGYRCVGKYAEAEKTHREVLELKQGILEPDDPEVLDSLRDLGNTLGYSALNVEDDQAKYHEAETMFRRELQSRMKITGLKNFHTIRALENLAGTLGEQGQYVKAEQMYRQVVKLRTRLYGLEDGLTIKSLISVADTLVERQKYGKAEKIYRKALRLSERGLEPENLVIQKLLSQMAFLLRKQGKVIQEERMSRHVLKWNMKFRGPENKFTLDSAEGVADTLERQEKYDQAERLRRHVFEVKERVLGLEDHETLDSMKSLANLLTKQRKHEEAESLNRLDLVVRERLSGPEDPRTIRAMESLSWTLCDQDKFEEAESLRRLVLEVREKLSGPEDTRTIQAIESLTFTLDKQGKIKEAWKMRQRIRNRRRS
ncbi:Regulatory protein AfsR [Colletotrichum gloeosporioides]|uniref:Regulatory protein AfsR n=1 Tax=Colletotrichum gloeosporioides TaxID=474922 RepID=A0A8H4CKX5_COLGL|nr:Regulatory protein AfsR [Colletotrichum gloeosporioides]KAF3805672.1 Regulatory protein AfsR [Colletotrichum gloeosporioides]